jgi:hypothetical protein
MSDTVENYPIINIPFLYKYGLTIQNSTVSPLTNLSILAGTCRDSNDVVDIRFGDLNPNINGVTTTAPVRIDNTITGAGGLDQGVVLANNMYAIFIISDSRGYLPISAVATVALYLFAVPPFPIMPAGYDSKRLIGFWATDSNKFWLKGYYYGLGNDLVFTYDAPQPTTITAGSSNSYVSVNLFNLVTQNYNSPASIYTVFNPGLAGDTLTLASGSSSAVGGQITITGQASGVNMTTISSVVVQRDYFPPFPLPLPSIQYKVSGTDSVAIYVAGFSVSV